MSFLIKDYIIKYTFRFLALFILVVLYNFWVAYECEKFAEITEIETKREPFTDCYLNMGDEWISYLTYQLRQIK